MYLFLFLYLVGFAISPMVSRVGGFIGALEPFCADGGRGTLSMRGHCAGRCLFFHVDTEPFPRTFSFCFVFYFPRDAPLALPPTGHARSDAHFRNRGRGP
ncbi:beta galactofuranosyl glycosyltransferase, putative, partial [Trypanosoma cruzi marinkellei]